VYLRLHASLRGNDVHKKKLEFSGIGVGFFNSFGANRLPRKGD